jgi:hypothetical protein
MNSQAQHELMNLMVSWALIGAIAFTLIMTALSLVGLLAFSNNKQRNKLFYILAAQIVLVGVMFSLGIFHLSPGAVVNGIEQPLKEAAEKLDRENVASVAERDRLKGELSETKRKLADSMAKAAAYDEQIAKANANSEAQREAIAHLQDLAQRAASEQTLANSQEVNAVKAQLAKAETELAESRQVEDTLNLRLKDNKSKASALEQSRRDKERQLQRAKAIGRVLEVNRGWNFVVLNIGDKQGMIPDSTLLVLRGGAQIAKLRVKTIEPSQSIADVISGSVRKGATVQPGDNVVFEEIRTPPAQASQHSTVQGSVQDEPALPPLPALTH